MILDRKLGGFSVFTHYDKADEEVKSYFTTVMKKHVGVGFTPLAVACQVVNGTNFAYFTTAQVIYPDAKPYNALVTVHVTTDGIPSLKEIEPIQLVKGSGENLVGGYTAFRPIDSYPKPEKLKEMLGIGVDYTALAAASQVVAGVNYAILAEAKEIYPGAEPYNVIVKLFCDLQDRYHVINIEYVDIL